MPCTPASGWRSEAVRTVILYATISLDGFIARADGGMDWLDRANSQPSDFGFAEFYAGIDTMLMGSATYEFLLGVPGRFAHADREVFVFTSRVLPRAAESVTLVGEDAADFTRNLKASAGGPIWLVGGGKLDASLLEAGLIDEMRIFVQPVVLGSGTGLFHSAPSGTDLELLAVKEWPGGVVELGYNAR